MEADADPGSSIQSMRIHITALPAIIREATGAHLGVELLVRGVVDKESPGGGGDVVVLVLSCYHLHRIS